MTKLEAISRLEKIATPIVYDGIEKFGIQDNVAYYTDETIKSIYPEKGPMCGYAYTAKIVGVLPKEPDEKVIPAKTVWTEAYNAPKPGIMVIEDTDEDPKRACAWGDYSASIFTALGFKGCITNGFVRAVDVVRSMEFKFFAKSTIAGHGNIRYKELGMPVRIGGMVIRPGDLLHADEHGVIIIPKELDLEELLKMIDQCLYSEGEVIRTCREPGFTLDKLFQAVDEHEARSGSHFK